MSEQISCSVPLSLPTLEKLNAKLPDDLDVKKIATSWLCAFGKRLEAGDAEDAAEFMLEDAFWRDTLALSWDFRTLQGRNPHITSFLRAVLPVSKPSNFKLIKEENLELEKPFPDLAWIQGLFSFETETGLSSGVFRIVPTATPGEWKAHAVYTNLDDLKKFPEAVGERRNMVPERGTWQQRRAAETAFEDAEPTVVIIGAGHSGLEVAARLKLLGVSNLILEKCARIGDHWRTRYETLCLHNPCWFDHMPYIPFPTSWPAWTPAQKLADWLEFYAQSMELDVWLSTRIDKVEKCPDGSGWNVYMTRPGGFSRVLKPRHVVFAHGFGGGVGKLPEYPGMDTFEGKILHSTEHSSARQFRGKKVVVIGTGVSGHDIAQDCADYGLDVTMFQRGPTYVLSSKNGFPLLLAQYFGRKVSTELADLISQSYPYTVMRDLQKRLTPIIAEMDKDLLDGLKRVGFKTYLGIDGTGISSLAYTKLGGYYIDVGASQLIIDGKIKVKSDSPISHFTKNSIVFENGSELSTDIVICATGYAETTSLIGQLIGKDVEAKIGKVWDVNVEGELNNVWRRCAVPGLYVMFGSLAMSRYFSKHLALLIKAQEEGLLKDPKF